ncbi:MAG: LamG domain-containing protein [Saprospiraceae bacterium]|nr:LamG domain-containing protein [Saprospiraceae bacterium]
MQKIKLMTDMAGAFSRITGILFFVAWLACAQQPTLEDHVIFFCSFDQGAVAEVSLGDSLFYTAKNFQETEEAKVGLHDPAVVLATGKGRVGDALHFTEPHSSAVYFQGFRNLGYSSRSWSGSCSFWLKVDPEKELAAGYCDPINLTDARFDDAALWVDFTDDEPRAFRMGVLGDLQAWYHDDDEGDTALAQRVVKVNNPPFDGESWTHIVLVYHALNTKHSSCTLYLNGEARGVVEHVHNPFSWNEEEAKIMLGLGYVGMMDELSIFDKALDAQEVMQLYRGKAGLNNL